METPEINIRNLTPFAALPSPDTQDLAGGADSKWDVSRRYAFLIANPASIPSGKFPEDFGTTYDATVPNGYVISVPSDPLMGNDDTSVGDEDNDPYAVCNEKDLGHAVNELSSRDRPTLFMTDAGGTENNTFEQSDLMQEFVRIQIGRAWYVVSDPLTWKMVEKLIYHGGHWQDNGSTAGPGN